MSPVWQLIYTRTSAGAIKNCNTAKIKCLLTDRHRSMRHAERKELKIMPEQTQAQNKAVPVEHVCRTLAYSSGRQEKAKCRISARARMVAAASGLRCKLLKLWQAYNPDPAVARCLLPLLVGVVAPATNRASAGSIGSWAWAGRLQQGAGSTLHV